MKKNRYKYANEELDFAVVEILEKDNYAWYAFSEEIIGAKGNNIKWIWKYGAKGVWIQWFVIIFYRIGMKDWEIKLLKFMKVCIQYQI